MRVIDAEIVLNRYQEICMGTACMDCPFYKDGCAVEKLILESAVIDAEPVIRCKDCKYNDHDFCNEVMDGCRVRGDWFCSGGERREE